ncbi:hypothetical protein [Streptomyces sp. NPDC096033]|uniref:hypothetical protein n=1 Tax=Streptomyces sp. NPDC096033 TaxID=3366071 RepID=UPI00380216C6
MDLDMELELELKVELELELELKVELELEVEAEVRGDLDMETLRLLLTAGVQRAGGSHGTGHSLLGPPRPGTCGGPRCAHWRAAIHPIG